MKRVSQISKKYLSPLLYNCARERGYSDYFVYKVTITQGTQTGEDSTKKGKQSKNK
jgi:hypothetical protein